MAIFIIGAFTDVNNANCTGKAKGCCIDRCSDIRKGGVRPFVFVSFKSET